MRAVPGEIRKMSHLRRCLSLAAGVVLGALVVMAVRPVAAWAAEGPPPGIERIEQPLAGWLSERRRPGPGSIDSLLGDFRRAGSFRTLLTTALAGDWVAAQSAAAAAEYRLFALADGDRWYIVLDDAASLLGPTVVLSPAAKRDLIVEAPHPVIDRYTVPQTAVLLSELGARAGIFAGAHRCAATAESSCSGKTKVCKDYGKAPYRDSDVAHNPNTLFHVAHEILVAHWPQAVAFSIHGFNKAKSAPDTWAVISDGGREEGGNADALTRRLRDALRETLGEGDARAVACDDSDDRRFGFQRLCAATNVQGRHLNGSDDLCRQSVARGSGRFIHIEQTLELRDDYEFGWRAPRDSARIRAMLDAVARAVPCLEGRCP